MEWPVLAKDDGGQPLEVAKTNSTIATPIIGSAFLHDSTPMQRVFTKITTSVESYYASGDIHPASDNLYGNLDAKPQNVVTVPLKNAVAFACKIAFIVTALLMAAQLISGTTFIHPWLALFIIAISVGFAAMTRAADLK
jgi:hypothetical protein